MLLVGRTAESTGMVGWTRSTGCQPCATARSISCHFFSLAMGGIRRTIANLSSERLVPLPSPWSSVALPARTSPSVRKLQGVNHLFRKHAMAQASRLQSRPVTGSSKQWLVLLDDLVL